LCQGQTTQAIAPISIILLDTGNSTSAVSLYRRKAIKAFLTALSAELRGGAPNFKRSRLTTVTTIVRSEVATHYTLITLASSCIGMHVQPCTKSARDSGVADCAACCCRMHLSTSVALSKLATASINAAQNECNPIKKSTSVATTTCSTINPTAHERHTHSGWPRAPQYSQ